MLTAMVETFGSDLKIRDKDIGDYLKEYNLTIQSPSIPFKTIEPLTCLIIITQKQNADTGDNIYLGYWIGNGDVPSIPTILIGDDEYIPKEIRQARSTNLFCVQEENIESILKPLVSALTNLQDAFEQASDLRVDARIKLREKLITETLIAMKTHNYNIEEYKESAKDKL